MNLTQLKYFNDVVIAGSVSTGARRSGVSQPAVSAQLKLLENELACKLFFKKNGRLRLTNAGRVLFQRSNDVLGELRNIERDVKAAADPILASGNLNVGCGPLLSRLLMPEIMTDFTRRHPDVNLSLFEEDSAKIPELIEKGDVDLGVGIKPGELNANVSFKKLLDDEFVLIIDDATRLDGDDEPIPLAKIRHLPHVATAPGTVIHNLIKRRLRFDFPHAVLHARNLETVVEFVKAGLGFSLVPRFLTTILSPAGMTLKAIRPSVKLRWGVFTHADAHRDVARQLMTESISRRFAFDPNPIVS